MDIRLVAALGLRRGDHARASCGGLSAATGDISAAATRAAARKFAAGGPGRACKMVFGGGVQGFPGRSPGGARKDRERVPPLCRGAGVPLHLSMERQAT